MPHAVAVSTGAQRLDNQTVLTYDVLVVSDSVDGGSTYIASSVPVDVEGLTAQQVHDAVAAQLVTDVAQQASVTLDASDLLFPARAKG